MHVEAPLGHADVEAPLCPPATSLAAKLGRWAMRRVSDSLKPVGLKPRQLGTLVELRNGCLSQQQLGDAVGIDAAQLVGLLNDLEADGLVVRRRDPGDRRRHIVEISELGRARLADADRAMAEVDARMMTGLTPEERLRFYTLLRFVTEHGGFDEECAASAEACETDGVDADAC